MARARGGGDASELAAPDSQTRAVWTRASAFDHMDASGVVLDGNGIILETNEAWRLFANLNDGRPGTAGPGVDYLAVCDSATGENEDVAARTAVGLRSVLDGELDRFEIDYCCSSPTEERWFSMQASFAPVTHGAGLVLFHIDITARKLLTDRLMSMDDHDVSTGLATLTAAERFLGERLIEVATPGIAVVRLGLGALAEIGHRYGAHVGTEFVIKVMMRTRRLLPAGADMFRSGDDELLAIWPGMDRDRADGLVADLRQVLAVPYQVGALEIGAHVEVSCVTSEVGSSADSILAAIGVGRNSEGARPGRRVPPREPLPVSLRGPGLLDVGQRSTEPTRGTRDPDRFDTDVSADGVADLAVFFDPDGTILVASPACRELFGMDVVDLAGLNWLDLIHPEDRDAVAVDLSRIPGFGDHVRSEFRIVDLIETVRWVEQIAINVVDDPDVGCIVGHLREITGQKMVEQGVAFRENLLAIVGQSVVATDPDGAVTFWNGAAESTYGWTASEAIGRHISELCEPVEGWAAYHDRSNPSVEAGRTWSGDVWLTTRAGAVIPVEVTKSALFDADGRPVGTIMVTSNISGRLESDRSQALLSAIVESSQDAIFSASLDGSILSWNGRAEVLFGLAAADAIGQHIGVVLPVEHADDVRLVLDQAGRGDSIADFDARGRRSSGTGLDLSISVSPVRSTAGAIIGVAVIARDITERTRFIQQIEADRRHLAVAQQTAGLGSFEIDLSSGVETHSEELIRLLGFDPSTMANIGVEHIHPDDRERVKRATHQMIDGSDHSECEYRIIRPDGEARWVLSQATRIRTSESTTIAGTILDITGRHLAEEALAHQATHDWLTDLPNMSSLRSSLADALALATRYDRVALAVVGLDRFGVVNDLEGHSIGDQVLKALAERLRTGMDRTDVVARSAGDQFMIMRADVPDSGEAHRLARQAMALLEDPFSIGDRIVRVTGSIGLTMSEGSESANVLLRDADHAMQQAKAEGRNRFVVLDRVSRARIHRRQSIAAALPDALERNELRLEYQPVIDLASGSTAGFEALIRWDHPTLGAIAPDEFIGIAEHTGSIVTIGSWVLETSLRQLASWRSDPRVPPGLWMAVNVSANQLSRLEFVEQVTDLLVEVDVPAGAVHLEITESILMDRVDNAVTVVSGLSGNGIEISIDDFGTGYSSLSYLSRLAVDSIKIDRSFISDLDTSGQGTSIVSAMVTLAHQLELRVVAEGIELHEQLEVLTELGCGFGQGFLWSPSLDPDGALRWMIDPKT